MIPKQWFVSSSRKSLELAGGTRRRDDGHDLFEIVASPTEVGAPDLFRKCQAARLSRRRLACSLLRFGGDCFCHRTYSRTFSKTRSAPAALPASAASRSSGRGLR